MSAYRNAELLVCLSAGTGHATLDTRGGSLDRALGAFQASNPIFDPPLTFSTGSVGFRCLELPQMLLDAQYLELLEHHHGDHLVYRARISESNAREIAFENGIGVVEFIRIAADFAGVLADRRPGGFQD